ncbi:hypothetical protein PG995_009125 [Apiospora arundinis]
MAMEPAKRDDEHDLDGDSEEWLTKETPLLYRALDPLLAPKDHISSFKPIVHICVVTTALEEERDDNDHGPLAPPGCQASWLDRAIRG